MLQSLRQSSRSVQIQLTITPTDLACSYAMRITARCFRKEAHDLFLPTLSTSNNKFEGYVLRKTPKNKSFRLSPTPLQHFGSTPGYIPSCIATRNPYGPRFIRVERIDLLSLPGILCAILQN